MLTGGSTISLTLLKVEMVDRHKLQWNPSITDTIGNQHFVLCSKVSASGIFPVGVVLRNPAVECNVAMFSELSFAARWLGRLSRG